MLSETILFCETSADDKAVKNAKKYVQDNGLTGDQVRILRKATLDITVVEVR